jgi:parallel beta-helix repeat protein
MKKIVLLAFVLVLLLTGIVWGLMKPTVTHTNENNSPCERKFVFAGSKTIWVPDNFTSIQEAINNANDGDTIFVRANTYYENVVVNKTVSLVGENKYDTIIDGTYTGTVIEVAASNVKITGFTVRNSGSTYPESGIFLRYYVSGCNISYNIITNNKFGIFVRSSSKNALTDNIVINNQHGIELMYSSENVLINNNASSNHAGVYLYAAHNNILTDNTVTNNNHGVIISHSCDNIICNNVFSDNEGAGIRVLEQSSGNLLFGNNASSNLDGFELTYVNDNTLVNNVASYNRRDGIQVSYSNSNVLISNEVSNNIHGIQVSVSSNNNTIYHNNFINNQWQAYISHFPLNTMWDDGYPSGGNYWSNYVGIDLYRERYQNETGSDGIGDVPYLINTENEDRYPFMNQLTLPDMQPFYVEFYELLAKNKELQSSYHNLSANCNSLQAELDDLQSKYNSLTNELNNTRNILYALLITTIIFIATTIYLVTRKHKVKPELKAT